METTTVKFLCALLTSCLFGAAGCEIYDYDDGPPPLGQIGDAGSLAVGAASANAARFSGFRAAFWVGEPYGCQPPNTAISPEWGGVGGGTCALEADANVTAGGTGIAYLICESGIAGVVPSVLIPIPAGACILTVPAQLPLRGVNWVPSSGMVLPWGAMDWCRRADGTRIWCTLAAPLVQLSGAVDPL